MERVLHIYFTGTITKLPATNAGVWEVTFSDGNKLYYNTEPEIRQVLDVTKMEQWQPLVTKLSCWSGGSRGR